MQVYVLTSDLYGQRHVMLRYLSCPPSDTLDDDDDDDISVTPGGAQIFVLTSQIMMRSASHLTTILCPTPQVTRYLFIKVV